MFPVFLIGGGWEPEGFRHTYGPFVKAATISDRQKIFLILADDQSTDRSDLAAKYFALFASLGIAAEDLLLNWVSATAAFDPKVLIAAHPTGVCVGGGLTPLYQTSLCANKAWVDYLHQMQLPYAGFSAGAAIAASKAIVGGWKVERDNREVEILDTDFSEGLGQLEVRPGLGLVPFAVDVHASQWGTLTRLMQAVDLELVHSGWAIDENTMLQIQGNQIQIQGLGHAYYVQRQTAGVLSVQLHRAGESLEFNESQ